MKTFHSETTRGFYPESMRADYEAAGSWPADAREISAQEEAELRAPTPTPFHDQLSIFMTEVRATRELILNRLAGIGMAAMFAGNNGMSSAVVAARQELLGITTHPDVVAAVDAENYEGLRAAVKARYKAIVAAVPAEVRTAFNASSE